MNLMKKQIFLLENLLKKILNKYLLLILIFSFITAEVNAKEKWVVDKDISKIKFEVPVLFATNVIGEFKDFDGFVEIDLNNKTNNKAIISIKLNSAYINYKKYKSLILSEIFFDTNNYPLAVIDTKKFSYEDEKELNLMVELTIKGKNKIIQTELKIKNLSKEIIQILGKTEFSRSEFSIGTGSWKNTTILKDNIKVNSEIYLIKE